MTRMKNLLLIIFLTLKEMTGNKLDKEKFDVVSNGRMSVKRREIISLLETCQAEYQKYHLPKRKGEAVELSDSDEPVIISPPRRKR